MLGDILLSGLKQKMVNVIPKYGSYNSTVLYQFDITLGSHRFNLTYDQETLELLKGWAMSLN